MSEDIEATYIELMNGYNYVNEDGCNDSMIDGCYHQLSAPGFNEMGSADIIAQII